MPAKISRVGRITLAASLIVLGGSWLISNITGRGYTLDAAQKASCALT